MLIFNQIDNSKYIKFTLCFFQTISHSKIQQHNKLCLDQQQTTQQLNKRRKSDGIASSPPLINSNIDNRLLNKFDSESVVENYRIKKSLSPMDMATLQEEKEGALNMNGSANCNSINNNIKTRRNLNCDEYDNEENGEEQEGLDEPDEVDDNNSNEDLETNNNNNEDERHIGLYEGLMKHHQNNFRDNVVPNMNSKRNINDILKVLTTKMKVSSLKDAKMGMQKHGDADIKW